jgi:PAS domain S-box-containing protein/putative nucleotidyltransferase with HDIG domain
MSVTETSGNEGMSVLDFDKDGIIRFGYGSFLDYLSVPYEELIGGSVFDIFHSSPELTSCLRKALDGLDSFVMFEIKDGSFEINFVPRQQNNINDGAIMLIRDRTREKLAESAFLTSDLRYRILFNSSLDSIFVFSVSKNSPPGKFVEVNDAACRKLGYSRKELLKLTLFDIEGDKLKELWKELSAKLFADGFINYETEFITSDGRMISAEITIHLFQLAGKNMALATARDVSSIRDAEEIIAEVHKQYEYLLVTMPDGILIHKDLIIQYSNQAAALLLGFDRIDDIIGKSILSFLHPNMHQKIADRMNEITEKKDFNPPNEYSLLLTGNITREVEVTDSYFQFRNSPAVLTILRDISERKNARKEMSQRQHYLESLLGASPVAIVTQDSENKIVEWNAQAEKLFGWSRDEALGKNIYSLITRPDVIDEAKQFTDALMNGKPPKPIESVRYRKDDKPVNVRINGSPLKEGTNLLGVVYTFQNLEELQEMEIARRGMEKTLRETLIQVTTALSKAQELRDPYTSGHGTAVSIIAVKIAEQLGWDRDRILGLELAGLLHDIGKLGVPIEILVKPNKLRDNEYAIIEMHPQMGYDLLKDIPFPFPIAEAVYQHHERINGTGYPNKMKGSQIITEAKILAVCDLMDAMSAFRPYREGYIMDEVIEELKRESGKLYDSEIVNTALVLLMKHNNQRFWTSK